LRELDPRRREQIEEALGRRLREDELSFAGNLSELTAAEVKLARMLAQRNVALGAVYLRALTDAGTGAMKRFMDDLASSQL
jgi:hypothetical protein